MMRLVLAHGPKANQYDYVKINRILRSSIRRREI